MEYMNEINFNVEDIKKIDLSMDVGIKEIYPSLENLEIIPTSEKQVFNHPNSYGYDKVTPTFLDAAKVTNGGLNAAQKKELAVKEYLCSLGYYEIQTIAMTAKTDFDMFLIPEDAKERQVVELLNPITENLSIMRTLMAPSMVRVIENNIKNGHEAMRFFEIANVYLPKALPLTEQPIEQKMICLGACGADEDFFAMKGSLEAFAFENDLESIQLLYITPMVHKFWQRYAALP